jgi:biopolymer transport protein ExbB
LLIRLLLIVVGVLFFDGVAFAQDEKGPESVSLWTMYNYGGIVGYLLTILSMISLGLAIEHFLSLRRDQMVPPDLVGHVEELFEEEAFEDVMNVCDDQPTMLTNVLAAGLPKIGTGYANISEAMQEVSTLEATKLNQKVSYIGLIASIAPLMGLFGTVTGMIKTFNTIATSAGSPNPKQLAGGIQQALVTTCMGLMVAIPATVLFFFFRNRVTRIILEINGIIDELMDRFREDA